MSLRLPQRTRGVALGVATLVVSPVVSTLLGGPVRSAAIHQPVPGTAATIVEVIGRSMPLHGMAAPEGGVAVALPAIPVAPPVAPAAIAPSQPTHSAPPAIVLAQPVKPPKPVVPPAAVALPPPALAAASGSIPDIIAAAARRHGVDPGWMVRIARCESTFNPHAVNPRGPYVGLFQFLASTFAHNGGHNIFDPADQAEVAATMLSHGQAHQWTCA